MAGAARRGAAVARTAVATARRASVLERWLDMGRVLVVGTAVGAAEAVAGTRPLALTVSLVLEEGLDADVLRGEVEAIAAAARDAGVEVVAGDTKVVERGRAESMYVCTTGLGTRDERAPRGSPLRPRAVRE